ncbi:MAG: CotH kinase family protein [Bacilli bacterium]|nr:CotH kinase family protein [Bacilli bacterium]
MKSKLSLILALLLIPCLSSCDNLFSPNGGNDDPVIDDGDKEEGDDKEEGGDDTPTIFDNDSELYKAFFDFNSKIEIELDFTNQAIYNLAQYGVQDFNKKEMYHPCTAIFTINGVSKTYKGMGARMKGNTSRNEYFVNENGYFDKNSNVWFNMKLSFTETFSSNEDCDYYQETFSSDEKKQERKDRRFGAMKKFDMKWNKNFDNTFTKESYANYILREEGLMSQRTNLVKLTVKSEKDSFETVYQVLETVDKQSLKSNLGKDASKGNLYKCSWPVNFTPTSSIGVESASFSPIYDLKTNDDEPNHDVLNNFLNVVNTTGDSETAKSAIEAVVDVDYFLKYSALMWVIGNPDDLRNNTNNTYIYFNNKNNLMYPIPYDNDRCFGIMQDWAIDTSTVTYYTTKRCGADRAWNENPLLWRTIIEETDSGVDYSDKFPVVSEWKTKYEEYCKTYAEKYLDVTKFQTFTNQFYYADKNIDVGGGSYPNMSFATYCTNKLGTLYTD